jgi:DNA polymerase
MNVTILDFETYFDLGFSLKKLSIPEYVHDPRFRVHGLAVRWPDGRAEFRADVDAVLRELQDRFGEMLHDTTVVGHHLQFDFYILNHRYNIRPRNFTDTMLLAHHVHGRRDGQLGQSVALGALAKHYGLEAKGELDFMCGLRTPGAREMAELSAYAKRDVEITYQLAERLLPQITRPEIELPIIMHTVRLFTERSINVDLAAIGKIEQEVHETTKGFFQAAGVTAEEVSKNGHFTRLLQKALERTGRSLPMKVGKRGQIPATARKDPPMQALLDDDDPVVAALAHARLEKKGQDQMLARLETLRLIAIATGGTLPPYLVYYGSHTGRFAGGGGFNIQNLGRTGLGAKIRGLLLPRPGSIFVIGDLAQIEARITAWYADEREMLQAFANDRDLYSEFASRVFGRPVRKPVDADSLELQAQLGPLRQVGKQAVLGLGFAMGALKFTDSLKADPKAARLFDTGELSPLICREIVEAFRRDYPGTPRLWAAFEEAARATLGQRDSLVSRVRFNCSDDVLNVVLPSGRALRYPDSRLDPTPREIRYLDKNGLETSYAPDSPSLVYGPGTSLYGGKLTENIVQATARDLLVEAMLSLENCGVRIAFHIHDEVVVEAPESEAQRVRDLVQQTLVQTPPWAQGLPIGCEVRVAKAYSK